MILSMTGFGRAEDVFEGKKITVDVKSLNSKSFDLNIKIPLRYKEKEFEIRKILNDRIIRGKVDCYVNIENLEESNDVKINKKLIDSYMNELRNIASDAPEFEYLKMAVRLPDAITSRPDELTDGEWESLAKIVNNAVDKFEDFRKTEGKTLHLELEKNIKNIDKYLSEVIPFEEVRIQSVKERYQKSLKEFENVDETRFYQEMAYFTEKLDIAEEKVRLTQHLKYYQEVMDNEDFNGKKLGFISQEIGREINTLGSKANHAEIQKLVVMMKDDLEKIKEQTLNVL
ncbi:YicC/YloC family endoribonuclease [Chryseobacterium polytrichastri]|uniref:TIGR00255 family protein n=1 Tax=Chryseobacterium polytrichastri TaxID=1302687 RepID=A0A1M7EFU7_9FLAO|nr:YicC/YloC family endoribonuclease [Chryseobacterium polytrichastri]SHL90506.1 TIGR00255 family protein [Chryseobacterium polytrichastri]